MRFPHHHIFQEAGEPGAAPLLLLHGTGGNEHDLLELGRRLSPGSALLSPRGNVLENGAPRFFRRFAEGVFDLDDVRARAATLAEFIVLAGRQYGFDPRRLQAVGFSNGANMGAILLQLHPELLAGGVLLRAMVVLDEPARAGSLTGRRVLLANGSSDPIVPADHPPRLASHLRAGGAEVELHQAEAGHGLTSSDFEAARTFMELSGSGAD